MFLRTVCEKFMRAGNDVLVCDPLGYSWPATWVTKNEYEFLDRAKRSKNCALIMDEMGETNVASDMDTFKWLINASRHEGHVFYGAMQDFTQMPLRMRKGVQQLFLFCCHPAESEEWEKKFHRDRDFIREHAAFLPQYHFIRLRCFAPPTGPTKLRITTTQPTRV